MVAAILRLDGWMDRHLFSSFRSGYCVTVLTTVPTDYCLLPMILFRSLRNVIVLLDRCAMHSCVVCRMSYYCP